MNIIAVLLAGLLATSGGALPPSNALAAGDEAPASETPVAGNAPAVAGAPAVGEAAVAGDEALASEAPQPSGEPSPAGAYELGLPDGPVPIGWFDVVVRGEFGEEATLRLDPVPDNVLVGSASRSRQFGEDVLRLPLASWQPGELVLDGLTVIDGERATALDKATVTVIEQPPKGTVPKVSELLEPLPLPLPPAQLAAFAALLALALTLIWIWIVRSSRVVLTPVYVPPADHLAIEALDRLRLALPRGEEEMLEFVVAVSGILRAYIEGRFEVHAPARTTEEFLAEAAAADGLLADRTEGLDGFLTRCDLVKYARHRPAPEDARSMIDSASRFVEETR